MAQLVKKLIADDLKKRMADFKRVSLQASVRLEPGHDYWWFQEFGTAGFWSDAPKYGLAPEDFQAPRSVGSHQPHGAGKYEIKPKHRHKLFFYWKKLQDWVFVPGGGIAKNAYGQRKGHSWAPIRKPYVEHPGVRPQAVLRRALWAFRNDVRLTLMNMARRKVPPLREDIAVKLNVYLDRLKASLEQQTPRYVQPPAPEGFSPSDKNRHDKHTGGPLADAWSVDRFDSRTTGQTWEG